MLIYRLFNIIHRSPIIFKFSPLQKIEAHALQVMHKFTDEVIRTRRLELVAGQTDPIDNNKSDGFAPIADDDDVIGLRKKRALLDILLHATVDDKPLTDLDIREGLLIHSVDYFCIFSTLLFTHIFLYLTKFRSGQFHVCGTLALRSLFFLSI